MLAGPVPVQVLRAAVSDPADADRYENGALLPSPHATLAGPTYEDWLNATS